jgi:hypothetical protein
MKSGSLNFLEPSGPLQVCNGTALPLPLPLPLVCLSVCLCPSPKTLYLPGCCRLRWAGRANCILSCPNVIFPCRRCKLHLQTRLWRPSPADERFHLLWRKCLSITSMSEGGKAAATLPPDLPDNRLVNSLGEILHTWWPHMKVTNWNKIIKITKIK